MQEYVRDDPTVAPRTLNYVSSQGCVYKCQFCYELTYQRAWSSMPADPLVDDIAELVEAFDLSGVKFYDADFFVQPRRAVDFSQALSARQLGIAWAASINHHRIATLLLVALVAVEATDRIFAIDSEAAIIAITTSTFIVWTPPMTCGGDRGDHAR